MALWLSDKQDAFVTGIAAEFPEVPHRYCDNHFLVIWPSRSWMRTVTPRSRLPKKVLAACGRSNRPCW